MGRKYRLIVKQLNGKTWFQIEAKWRGWMSIFGWSYQHVGEFENYDLPIKEFDEAMEILRKLQKRGLQKVRIKKIIY